jgi:hypothetical protein
MRLVLFAGSIGAFGFFLHPLFVVCAGFTTVCYGLPDFGRRDFSSVFLRLTGIALISVVPNIPWILDLLDTISVAVAQPYQREVGLIRIPTELLGVWNAHSMGSKINAGLLIGAILACLGPKGRERYFCRISIVAWLAVSLFAALGGAWNPTGAIQPNRFSGFAYLLLAVPAAMGIVSGTRALFVTLGLKRVLVAGAVFAVGLSVSASAWEVVRETSSAPIGHYGAIPPEVRGLGPKSMWLIAWIEQNTTHDGRILFETSLGRTHDGAHMAGYYALTTDREFIGGPYPFNFFAGFWDGFCFGKKIGDIPATDFTRYLDLYNIGWIVVHSDASKLYLDAMPGVERVADFADLRIYSVSQALTYVINGSATLDSSAINAVAFKEVKGTELVLKYRYVSGLKAAPAGNVEPYQVPGSPDPFVRVTGIEQQRVVLSRR